MNDNQHLSSQFDEELDRLRSHVLEMGGLVENQVSSAIEIYATGEASRINPIIETERHVNALEKIIDDDCAHIIARRQPTASDLRMVLGIGKAVTDLERIGDEAKKIARTIGRLLENGHLPEQYGFGVRHLAESARAMLRQALDAFARLDTVQAGEVIRSDSNVDSGFRSIVRQMITYMMEDPRTIGAAIDIIWIANAIVRIGDHAKNISEQVIYIAEGRDIRHSEDNAP